MTFLIDAIALSKKNCDYPIGCELKYATEDNFVGRVIDGYEPAAKNCCFVTPQIAHILCEVQNNLIKNHQLGLFVLDAYRPQRAVKDFLRWINQPPASEYELIQKTKHYPNIEKSQLFDLGYLTEDSNHCYGNTVDCLLQDLKSGELLAMGTIFDFFGELSHSNKTATELGETVYQHRKILAEVMQQFGFKIARTEYWHFTHQKIKEILKPLDIPITPDM